MKNIEKQVAAIANVLLAEDEESRRKAKQELMRVAARRSSTKLDAETIIQDILLELGAPDHLMGYPYVVKAIQMVVADRNVNNSITFGLYPALAVLFDTTANRVKRSIRHLIETCWERGDPDVQFSYFGNTVSPDRGKPTNSEFISRIANVVARRMQEAA